MTREGHWTGSQAIPPHGLPGPCRYPASYSSTNLVLPPGASPDRGRSVKGRHLTPKQRIHQFVGDVAERRELGGPVPCLRGPANTTVGSRGRNSK